MRTPLSGRQLDPYFEAVVDASEEAVLSSMLAAHDVTGVDGRTVPALPVERVRSLLAGRN
jgi:D-aminopeptidase